MCHPAWRDGIVLISRRAAAGTFEQSHGKHVETAGRHMGRPLFYGSTRADVFSFQSFEQSLAGAAGVFDCHIFRPQRPRAAAQAVACDDFFACVVDQCVAVDEYVLDLRVLMQLRVWYAGTQGNRTVDPVADPFDMIADDLMPCTDHPNAAGTPVAVTQDQIFANDAVVAVPQCQSAGTADDGVPLVEIVTRLVGDEFDFTVAVFEQVPRDHTVCRLQREFTGADPQGFEAVAVSPYHIDEVIARDTMRADLTVSHQPDDQHVSRMLLAG